MVDTRRRFSGAIGALQSGRQSPGVLFLARSKQRAELSEHRPARRKSLYPYTPGLRRGHNLVTRRGLGTLWFFSSGGGDKRSAPAGNRGKDRRIHSAPSARG